ncbi:DUF1997 domain-containing protein [Cronbergia sp. UHCC 0137]|uniref:DUF1997 domain-containing protein n=1 Tax=Cronbergia sp. UHCC 0137 TaxID=3110239 RepID=UPI002B20FB95|nr:DUF1997 domain-containing protein [Cronbergia sp. UHCC 0137]MEA5616635.1 DUF1997 domain-containing protein [Cronbergia sp. UHCC 0137]
MVSQNRKFQSLDINESGLPGNSNVADGEPFFQQSNPGITKFYVRYQDCMEMYAPTASVIDYLNNHSLWFANCAEPMTVQSLGENAYALVIGRFSSFGYEVEPKIGLELLPADQGIYRIRTIPIPDYHPPGYDVDYQASLQLVEDIPSDVSTNVNEVTKVEWQLDLRVELNFPKFIQRLPHSLIQSTGDRLLMQIVRQVSRRLTRKVQENFHQSLGIPFPLNCHKHKK